jgi:hypothetical protein
MTATRDEDDKAILHNPPNHLLRIDAIWAFVSVDEDGNEGLCAMTLPGLGLTPLIAADEARLESLRRSAQSLATKSGKAVRLIRLHSREDLEVIKP